MFNNWLWSVGYGRETGKDLTLKQSRAKDTHGLGDSFKHTDEFLVDRCVGLDECFKIFDRRQQSDLTRVGCVASPLGQVFHKLVVDLIASREPASLSKGFSRGAQGWRHDFLNEIISYVNEELSDSTEST